MRHYYQRWLLPSLLFLLPSLAFAATTSTTPTGPTFAQYVFSGMFSPWILLAAAFVSATAGMVTHWFKKVQRDGLVVSLREWWMADYKNTLLAIGSVWVATWAAIAPVPITEMSLWGAIMLGFPIGYASDSAFNKVEDTKLQAFRAKHLPK